MATGRLGLYETENIVPVQQFQPGVYTFKQQISGNSILATLYVLYAGNVHARWFDYGPGNNTSPGEQVVRAKHNVPTTDDTSERLIVTRIHNTPILELTVVDTPVTLGVKITVISDFPQDEPISEGKQVDFDTDKGSPLALYDSTDNTWHLAKGVDGKLEAVITSPVPVQVDPVSVPTIFTLALDDAGQEYSFVIPIGTRRYSFQVREYTSLRVAYELGGTTSDYWTLPGGCEENEGSLKGEASITVFVSAPKSEVTLEVKTWA